MSIITSDKLPIISEERSSPPSSPRYDEPDLIGTETEDFNSKIEREVVKVPKCTYSNEAKSASKYFLCTCSTSAKGFDLICEACAKHCHKQHAPTLEVPGANLCSCGQNNHIITPEMKAMYDCIEVYGLEEATVLELAAYCIEQKGKRVSTNYILAAAQTWNEQGIISPAQAKEYLEAYRAKKHGAAEVLARWNKRRKPTQDEMDLYDKWVTEWGFDGEAILAACPQLVEVGTPTFAILNDRLEQLKDQNLTTAEEIGEKANSELDDREFCKLVFARLGKMETPSRTDIAQISMFLKEKGISKEAILFAADESRSAERPFGMLKKVLIDWAARNVTTLQDAEKAYEERRKQPAQRTGRRGKNRVVEGYSQAPIRDEDVEGMIVDLDQDL